MTEAVEIVSEVVCDADAVVTALVLPLDMDLLELVRTGGQQGLQQAALPHPPDQVGHPAEHSQAQEQQGQPLVVGVHYLQQRDVFPLWFFLIKNKIVNLIVIKKN